MHQDTIQADPTKRLFINILTQDVPLRPAILDLIDNSVDSYTRKKLKDRRKIDLTVTKDKFAITDDCGGISLDILKEQVFRFGSKVDKLENPTLGMYGIGLKRSIFKIGKRIVLETHDGKDYSLMDLDVSAWEKNDKSWDIPFQTEENELVNANPFTSITITNLTDESSNKFNSDIFRNELVEVIKRSYCLIMKDEVDIFFNGHRLTPFDLYVPQDDHYKPSVLIDNYDSIDIKIICFLEPSKGTRLRNAINQRGWNVFCNNRLILANDTSELTGWKGAKEDMSSLPKYHQLFNEFRGMVFLTANNPFKLPLNTSKTSLNTENENYQYILKMMIKAARPIIEYIYEKNKKESEELEVIEGEILKKVDEEFKPVQKEIVQFDKNEKFKAPLIKEPVSTVVKITYTKDKDLVESVKEMIGATSNREVGEKTFDYYTSMEL